MVNNEIGQYRRHDTQPYAHSLCTGVLVRPHYNFCYFKYPLDFIALIIQAFTIAVANGHLLKTVVKYCKL